MFGSETRRPGKPGRGGLARRAAIALGAAAFALALTVSASAGSKLSNGGFENGKLRPGWKAHNYGADKWIVYAASEALLPISGHPPFRLPPQGTHAAITDQDDPGAAILTRRFHIPRGKRTILRLTVFYSSEEPIAARNSLSFHKAPNQQYRVDLLRRGAAVKSMKGRDILGTLFRTRTDGPTARLQRILKANLTRFAGKTVTLRLALVASENFFQAGVDAVSLSSKPRHR